MFVKVAGPVAVAPVRDKVAVAVTVRVVLMVVAACADAPSEIANAQNLTIAFIWYHPPAGYAGN
jgi:hypothetical protein